MIASVIIPTINRKDYLPRSIESVVDAVKNQDLAPDTIELILVNDSNEELDISGFYNEIVPIKVINSPQAPFGGPSLARHAGVLNSSAELIFFLDDDDFFLANRFKYCLEIYQNHPYIDVVLEPSIRKDVATEFEFIAGAVADVENGFFWMLDGDESCHIATGGTSFRRSSYLDVGGMDLKLKYGEDGELLLRLAYYKNVKFTFEEAVVQCERHRNNISHESKRRYFQNMNAIASLYKNTRIDSLPYQDVILESFIQSKFTYLLSRCIQEYSYPKRIFESLLVAFYFPWRLGNKKLVKSLLVALFKVSYR